MNIDIDVSELNQLAVDISKLPLRVQLRAGQIVRKTANNIEATAKAFAPVDTGFLRNSIHTTLEGPTAAVVAADASYAAFVEYGTARQAPAAFMGPAADRHGWEFLKAFENLADGLL